MEGRDELLTGIGDVRTKQGDIDSSVFIVTLMAIAVVLALLIPKIYISSNIYYQSRHIERLKEDLVALKEENRALKRQLQQERFDARSGL